MRTEQPSNPDPGLHPDEGRTRSVGELLQHLGATKAQEVSVAKIDPAAGTSTLEVHRNTEERLNWKPEFVALSGDGRLKLVVTRLEAESLVNAGAAASPP